MKAIAFTGSLLLLAASTQVRAQSPPPATPTPPPGTTVAARPRAALPLPEKYARKFGTGATGAKAAEKVLLNPASTRESIIEALDAVTFYGPEGARVLFRFGAALINPRGTAPDATWCLPTIAAMEKVPDRSFQSLLLNWARYSTDANIREKALKALGVLVANSDFEIPGDGDPTHTFRNTGTAFNQGWHSLGDSMTLDQRHTLKRVVLELKDQPKTPDAVRKEAERLLWWIGFREEQESRALAIFRAQRNGEPVPEGIGYGGFGQDVVPNTSVVPPTPEAPARPRAALPLPEKYARKFGTGATGAKAAEKVLLNPASTRESIIEALDAVTFYGHEGACALFVFANAELKRNSLKNPGDASRYIPIVNAMAKVPDKESLPILLHWTRYGGDPVLRAKALNALALLVANADSELPTGTTRGARPPWEDRAFQGWNSLGKSITIQERDTIRDMAQRVLNDAQTPQTVRHAANALMSWINLKEKDQKATARNEALRRGEPIPKGMGFGGFGTRPAP